MYKMRDSPNFTLTPSKVPWGKVSGILFLHKNSWFACGLCPPHPSAGPRSGWSLVAKWCVMQRQLHNYFAKRSSLQHWFTKGSMTSGEKTEMCFVFPTVQKCPWCQMPSQARAAALVTGWPGRPPAQTLPKLTVLFISKSFKKRS